MEWFIFLLCPFLFSLSTLIDKYLVGRYFRGDIGAMILFSSLISVITLPVIYFIHPAVFEIESISALVLIFVGFLYILYLFPYLKALKIEDTSRVAPIFQSIPVFGIVLAFFILGESIPFFQLFAGGLIILGSIGITINFGREKILFKKKVLFLMLLASLLVAFSGVVFKLIATENDFWVTLFWEQIGFVLLGVLIFAFIPHYRRHFLEVFKKNSAKVLALNLFNEVINIIALSLLSFATLLAPIGFVWLINGVQPAFIFFFGFILTIFFPRLIKEDIRPKVLLQKLFFIILIFIGVALLGSVPY
jgi:drug/metabolite transporter (DMT)-like permease